MIVAMAQGDFRALTVSRWLMMKLSLELPVATTARPNRPPTAPDPPP